MISELLLTGIKQGLILAFVTYGIMIPFRLLRLSDLTAEGAYPLGGTIFALALLQGLHPIFAVIFAACAAGALGIATCLIHLRLRIDPLLAGIIVSIMAYSVNLRLLGKPNVALFNTGFNIISLTVILFIATVTLYLFLKTEKGLQFRAVGLNPQFAQRQGIRIEYYTLFGLFLASFFSGLSGAMMVQMQTYMDVGMGVGIVIHGLASLMIGEKILGNNTLVQQLLAPLFGALVYQQILGMAMLLGLAPSDLKFFTGLIVLFTLAVQIKERQTA